MNNKFLTRSKTSGFVSSKAPSPVEPKTIGLTESTAKPKVSSPTNAKPANAGLATEALEVSGNSNPDSSGLKPANPGFSNLGLSEPLLRALKATDYTTPTPIQAQAIPLLLKGQDLLGIAQTGTGKTAAFALPILQRLAENREANKPRNARTLILAPTRELAIQISDSFKTYGRYMNLQQAVIFGGVKQQAQVRAMARGVDVLVATPGRLLDLIKQGHVRLDQAGILVLDEADRMLDMGFVRDVRKIIAALPKQRQSLLFSATMPSEIAHLASDILNNPARVEVTPKKITVDRINQGVYFVDAKSKRSLLNEVLQDPALARVIVFTRTKHRANRVAEQLDKSGISADAIHGNKSQAARQRALQQFRGGHVRVLVATDIAARGIDIDDVTHVINFELPNEPESYVHRIGRTARAGAEGAALSFCDSSERSFLREIERLTKRPIAILDARPILKDAAPLPAEAPRSAQPSGRPGAKPFNKGGKGKGFGGQSRDGQARNGNSRNGQSRRRSNRRQAA